MKTLQSSNLQHKWLDTRKVNVGGQGHIAQYYRKELGLQDTKPEEWDLFSLSILGSVTCETTGWINSINNSVDPN